MPTAFASTHQPTITSPKAYAGARPPVREKVSKGRYFGFQSTDAQSCNQPADQNPKTPHQGHGRVACALLGLDADDLLKDRTVLGQLLETFVCQELRQQASWRDDDVRFHHFRDKDGYEVEFLLGRGAGQIAGIEVKASATVTAVDFRGLRRLREGAGKAFVEGVVLCDGETSVGFGEGLWAIPIRALWEGM
jgi:hypothetical protein